jgi:tripartite-type tricarboxylate transporter receptor subunit TctC
VAAALTALIATTATAPVLAADYPNKPVRFLLGQAPAGGQDLVARALAQKLTDTLGQSVIVDNRPGAGGTLAAALAAKAAPDGYTVLFVSATFAIIPALYQNLQFDPVKDFQPVAQIVSTPFILLLNPGVPARTVKELIAYAKENPRKLNYASGGIGNTGHLSAALFAKMANVELTHVPYKGTGLAMPDLLAGRVQILFNSMFQGVPYVKRRQLVGLAVTTRTRSPLMPDVPTIAESGVPGYEFKSWYGLLVPAGTPKAIIVKLSDGVVKTLASPEMKAEIARDGGEPASTTPQRFAAFIAAQTVQLGEIVRSSGMKVE